MYIILSNDYKNIENESLDFALKLLLKRFEIKQKEAENEIEKRIWQMYLVDYANMDKSNYMPYLEYYKKYEESKRGMNKTKSNLSKEDIFKKAEKIRNIDKENKIKKGLK
jgi:hypothetical protein